MLNVETRNSKTQAIRTLQKAVQKYSIIKIVYGVLAYKHVYLYSAFHNPYKQFYRETVSSRFFFPIICMAREVPTVKKENYFQVLQLFHLFHCLINVL